MSTTRFQHTIIVGLAICLTAALMFPLFPRQLLIQHAPTAVAVPFLFLAARRSWLSNAAMSCIIAFLLIHTLGARYAYSDTPFGESLSILSLGGDHVGRNHYDRFTHLAFGALAMCPLVEISLKFGGLRLAWARALALFAILSAGALYEIFEWLITIFAAPEFADTYNGQQGDSWDAQKDMALAAIGALALLPFVGRKPSPRVRRPSAGK